MKDPRKRPKLHTDALQEWFENPRYTLKIHVEPLGKSINTLIDTRVTLRYLRKMVKGCNTRPQ